MKRDDERRFRRRSMPPMITRALGRITRSPLAVAGSFAYLLALAVHVVVHASASGAEAFAATPMHLALLGAGSVALAALFATFGVADDGERRRRAALISAALRRRGAGAGTFAAHAIFLATVLCAEHATIAPERLAEAIVIALVSCFVATIAARYAGAFLSLAVVASPRSIGERDPFASTLDFGPGRPLFALAPVLECGAPRAPPVR